MPERLAVLIGIFNSKGGVGKTTVAVNLAAALAAPRRRVLLVDLDSQASASLWLGVTRNQLRPSAASVLLDKYPILKAIRHTSTPHLDLLTGSLDLANADVTLCSMRGREVALARALERARPHYDLILLDCPPGMSLLGVNAMLASDALLVPVCPEPLAAEALENLFIAIQRVRARLLASSRLLGIVLSGVDPTQTDARSDRAAARRRSRPHDAHRNPLVVRAQRGAAGAQDDLRDRAAIGLRGRVPAPGGGGAAARAVHPPFGTDFRLGTEKFSN